MARSTLPLTPSGPSVPPSWRERTLARLIDHVRSLVPAGAVAFVPADAEQDVLGEGAGWFADDALRDLLAPSISAPLRHGGLVAAALERDRPLLLPRVEAWEVGPELLAGAVGSLGRERADRAWRIYGGASLVACPVRSEVGEALGVLIVVSGQRPLDAGDVRTMEVLADLAAMALERAVLLEAEGRHGRRELRLERATEEVLGSLELDVVYERVVRHAAAATGASRALLSRLSSRTGELRSVAQVDFSDELTRQALALGSGSFGEVARAREPVLRRRSEAEGFDLRLMEAQNIGSLMLMPIELGPRLYGVLTVAHEEAGRFSTADLDVLARLARSAAAAIANAIDFGRERRIARALTLGFVPESLPALAGYETGLVYEPAADEPTGGDIYGAWPVSEGIAVLVGDVAGKGVQTAALSAMSRFFIEARSHDSASPARVLESANAMLGERLPSDTFVTAFLGVLSGDSLRYCSAGHLPPVHVSGGRAAALEGHALPLGIDPSCAYADSWLRLAPGDLVFAYTDGLVEARRSGELYGVGRLVDTVVREAADRPPELLVRAVYDEVAGWADGLSDDAVALALRRASA